MPSTLLELPPGRALKNPLLATRDELIDRVVYLSNLTRLSERNARLYGGHLDHAMKELARWNSRHADFFGEVDLSIPFD